MQETVRNVIENGVVESRAAFVKAKVSAKDASNAFELSFAAAKDGVVAFNAKAFAAVRANTEANLDFVKASLTAKSVSDFVALQSEFARKQTDAVVVQFQELAELAKNTVVETLRADQGSGDEVVQDRGLIGSISPRHVPPARRSHAPPAFAGGVIFPSRRPFVNRLSFGAGLRRRTAFQAIALHDYGGVQMPCLFTARRFS